MTSCVRAGGMFILPLALALAACDGPFDFPGRAADEWTRSYSLADGGQLQISNTNGLVEVEGVTGSTVEVRAERVAHATTDSAARGLLSHIVIKEDVTPTRISIESERTGSSFLMSLGYEVHYHVRAPKNAVVRATTTNGRILLTALSGATTAATTNGGVRAEALTGGIRATSTNGTVDVELTALDANQIDLRTTNGEVSLTLPVDAKADLDASVTNGAISVTGLKFEVSGQSRRHLSARINGGGTPVTVSTTNGAIRIGGR
jgi:Putative adhesin